MGSPGAHAPGPRVHTLGPHLFHNVRASLGAPSGQRGASLRRVRDDGRREHPAPDRVAHGDDPIRRSILDAAGGGSLAHGHAQRRGDGLPQSPRRLPAGFGGGGGDSRALGRPIARSTPSHGGAACRLAALCVRCPGRLLPLLFPRFETDGGYCLVDPLLDRIDLPRGHR